LNDLIVVLALKSNERGVFEYFSVCYPPNKHAS